MKKGPKKVGKKASHAELLSCLPYLHGDVIDGEFEAACCYEYARESKVLPEATRLWAATRSHTEVAHEVEKQFQCGVWFIQLPWSFIWQCPSFPAKSWNQLAPEERKDLLCVFPTTAIQPLLMNEAPMLDAMGVFDKLKAMAAEATETRNQNLGYSTPIPKVFPIVPVVNSREGIESETPWVHALFTLDFRKPPTQLKNEFVKWLALPENEARFANFKQDRTGTTGKFRDRLKDISSWRLSRALGWVAANAYTIKHRLGDSSGTPRAFLDARTGQTEKGPLNQAPIYADQSGWSDAKDRAEKYRAEVLSFEFGVDVLKTDELRANAVADFRAALERTIKGL